MPHLAVLSARQHRWCLQDPQHHEDKGLQGQRERLQLADHRAQRERRHGPVRGHPQGHASVRPQTLVRDLPDAGLRLRQAWRHGRHAQDDWRGDGSGPRLQGRGVPGAALCPLRE